MYERTHYILHAFYHRNDDRTTKPHYILPPREYHRDSLKLYFHTRISILMLWIIIIGGCYKIFNFLNVLLFVEKYLKAVEKWYLQLISKRRCTQFFCGMCSTHISSHRCGIIRADDWFLWNERSILRFVSWEEKCLLSMREKASLPP